MRKTTFIFLMMIVSLICSSETVGYNWVDVTNVDSEDTLSVRSQPTAASEKVGELQYDQVGIRVMGETPQGEASNWISIQSGSLSGWVNQHYVKPTELADFEEPLKCLGTEPFWSLDTDNGQITFSDMGDEGSTYAVLDINQSQNHTNAWLFRLSDGSNEGRISLKKTEQCSDDMSDRVYDYELGIELPEGRFITGCCNSQ